MATSPAVAHTAIEATTVRKVRARIIPLVFVLFVIAFIDRINIGFAALTMNKALAITSEQFGLLSGIFFLGYFLFEIPSNLLLYKLGARIWVARILVSWGVVAILTGLVTKATHLYFLRFLLGVAEAGYFPGIILYLTYWFRQRQLAHALAIFLAGVPVANIIGAPVSGAILDHIHWFGIGSWRWLLILEGVPALLGGGLTWVLLPDRPADAKFLTFEEKNWLATEVAREEQDKLTRNRISVVQTLSDRRVWHLAAILFPANIGLYAMTLWMPQFIKAVSNRGSNTTVGILVMVPYLVALIAMIFVGRSSDKRLERCYHAAIPLLIGGVSFTLLAAISGASMFLTVAFWCVIASCIESAWSPIFSLPNEFLTGFSAAAGIALINSIGSIGGFVGPYALGEINKGTGSFRGGLVFAGASLFISAMLILALRKRTAQPALETATVMLTSGAGMPNIEID
jgi:ACS family tartrate transporter-like MFS transporter